MLQIPDAASGERQKEYGKAYKKRDQVLPEGIRGLVGIHAKQHHGIGPVHAPSLVADDKPDNASGRRKADGNGEAADDHGQ